MPVPITPIPITETPGWRALESDPEIRNGHLPDPFALGSQLTFEAAGLRLDFLNIVGHQGG
jgi:hypothetical protein